MSASTWQHRRLPDTSESDARARWGWRITAPAELTAARRALHSDLDREAARPAGTQECDIERLLLAFEELASNGLRHGGPPVTVDVICTDNGWLIDVVDSRPDVVPTPAVGRDPANGGLGLQLIARLATTYGWDIASRGKHVWACIMPLSA